jgi:hypothetical protein
MEEFIIQGGPNFLKITIEEIYGFPKETCSWGGYDTRSTAEISSYNFKAKSNVYLSTGELFEFYKKLMAANRILAGDIHFVNYEGNLHFNIKYNVNGHVSINGKFSAQSVFENTLNFEFESDQTYMQSTVTQLQSITEKYGDMKGAR